MDKVTVDYYSLNQEFWIQVQDGTTGCGYSVTAPLEPMAELVYNRNPSILKQIVSKVHAHATKMAFEVQGMAGDKDLHYERVLQLHKENEELKRRLEELESTSHWVDKVIAMGGDVPMKEGTTEHDMLVKAFTALEEAKKLEEDARKDQKLV